MNDYVRLNDRISNKTTITNLNTVMNNRIRNFNVFPNAALASNRGVVDNASRAYSGPASDNSIIGNK